MLNDENQYEEKKTCIQCGASLALKVRFCNSCGTRQDEPDNTSTEKKWRLLKQSALFYAIDLFACCLGNFVEYFKTFHRFIILDALMAINGVVFFALLWQENKKLLKWRNFSIQKIAAYGAIAIISALLVHYSVGWLNTTIFPKREHVYFFYGSSASRWLMLVFFDAVMPAMFEELQYRGYLMQVLLKVADPWQVVYISSFLFAIIHMSFVSLFWLIPFALFLAMVRIREKTIWYGIFIHFCFNLTACLFELL